MELLRRKIHIGDDVYRYRIGKKFVVIQPPEGERHLVSIYDLLPPGEASTRATEWMEFLESQFLENNYNGFGVYPSDVKAYIQRTFVVDELSKPQGGELSEGGEEWVKQNTNDSR